MVWSYLASAYKLLIYVYYNNIKYKRKTHQRFTLSKQNELLLVDALHLNCVSKQTNLSQSISSESQCGLPSQIWMGLIHLPSVHWNWPGSHLNSRHDGGSSEASPQSSCVSQRQTGIFWFVCFLIQCLQLSRILLEHIWFTHRMVHIFLLSHIRIRLTYNLQCKFDYHWQDKIYLDNHSGNKAVLVKVNITFRMQPWHTDSYEQNVGDMNEKYVCPLADGWLLEAWNNYLPDLYGRTQWILFPNLKEQNPAFLKYCVANA